MDQGFYQTAVPSRFHKYKCWPAPVGWLDLRIWGLAATELVLSLHSEKKTSELIQYGPDSIINIIFTRPRCYAQHKMQLIVTDEMQRSVCCSHPRALHKWLKWLRCRLGCGLCKPRNHALSGDPVPPHRKGHFWGRHTWARSGLLTIYSLTGQAMWLLANTEVASCSNFYPHDVILAPVLAVALSLSVKLVFYQKGWTDQCSFWHRGFFQPIIHCVLRKYRYLEK